MFVAFGCAAPSSARRAACSSCRSSRRTSELWARAIPALVGDPRDDRAVLRHLVRRHALGYAGCALRRRAADRALRTDRALSGGTVRTGHAVGIASQAASAAAWRQARDAGHGKLLVCRDVDVEYDGVQVLFGVDFDVDEGEIVALLGTNGAGKSTLLTGDRRHPRGIIRCGRLRRPRHHAHASARDRRQGVVSMPGGRGVFPDLTVEENLMLGNWLSEDEAVGRAARTRSTRSSRCSRSAGDERAQLLSGGEQQMLSLAMAFLNKPRLLMIDELSLGLSPAVVQQLIEFVRAIHAAGNDGHRRRAVGERRSDGRRAAIFMEKGEVRFVGRHRGAVAPSGHPPRGVREGHRRARRIRGRPSKTERERRRYSLENARAGSAGARTSRSRSAASRPSRTSRSTSPKARVARAHRSERRRQDDDLRHRCPAIRSPTPAGSSSTAST